MLGAGGHRGGSRLTTRRPLAHTAGVLRLPLAPGALRGGGELASRGLEQRQGGRPVKVFPSQVGTGPTSFSGGSKPQPPDHRTREELGGCPYAILGSKPQ